MLKERHGGELRDSPYSPYPVLCLPMSEAIVHLAYNSAGGDNPRSYTSLYVLLPDERPRLSLYDQQADRGIGRLLGMQDIELGVPDFDINPWDRLTPLCWSLSGSASEEAVVVSS